MRFIIDVKKKSGYLLLFIICFLLNFSFGYAKPRKGPVPGRFIVKLSKTAKPDIMRKSLSNNIKFEKVSPLIIKKNLKRKDIWKQFYVFSTKDTTLAVNDVINKLGRDDIEYVEQDHYLELFSFPTDSLFNDQWYLYNHGQQYLGIDRYEGKNNDSLVLKSGTPGKDVRLVNYYASPPAEHTQVVVAIIDSGVDWHHPELQGQFWHNPDEIPGNGIDDDHNGYVDDTLGYDISGDDFAFFNPIGDNDPTDSMGHGTHLAGLVASRADNKGVVGIAPQAKIMAVKIFPNATNSVAAEGIMYAVNAGAQVINISWGGPFVSGILREALEFARANNVFVSIAAGNSGSTDRFYPAAFDSSFTVAAGNSDGYLTYFTTYGAPIDLVAPGRDILSLRAAGTDMYARDGEPGVRIVGADSLYYLADGTSMAAPIVAGAAALILSLHPNLSVSELENVLLSGATDIVDPFNQGDTLIGPDTISGYGYLNVDASLSLLEPQGLKLIQPQRQQRYTEDVMVKVAPLGGYSGAWTLEYSLGYNPANWEILASGNELPQDSILYVFNDSSLSGRINLKLIDKNGKTFITFFIYVPNNITEITSPTDGQQMKYHIPIYGSVFGPDYDSMAIYYSKNGGQNYLMSSTGEYFDSLLYQWSLSGIDTGRYNIYLFGYYHNTTIIDSTFITIKSTFAAGWPKRLGGRGALTPVCADLNHDGVKEIIACSGDGIYMFHPDGSLVDGFPVMSGVDMRCIPAIYDVDRDGQDEIIATNDSGIYIFKYDGSFAPGWPQKCYTGLIPYGYGYPNPTVTQLGYGEDSAVVIINKIGQIRAYEFNGDSYFYSLQGLFATFDPRISNSWGYGGSTSPFVTSTDLNGDGLNEVVASYTSPFPYTGLGLFDGRTGRPAFGWDSPLVIQAPSILGTALADFNGDHLMETVSITIDTLGIPHIWIKTNGYQDYPGWPLALPEAQDKNWIGAYPVLADLDLDGVPEILCSFLSYDISRLYIFKADGTPYAQQDGQPYGVAFVDNTTFSMPIVANLTGDEYPEIVFRSGYILPGTGPERLYILDHNAQSIPGWPVITPARNYEVFTSWFTPLIDDIDNDGLVELLLISDNGDLLVWDFDASSDGGKNTGRFLGDNLNTNTLKPVKSPTNVNDDNIAIPKVIKLAQNYPNPFNPLTTITYELPRFSQVSFDIFNILGQKVASLVNKKEKAGMHKVTFDGSAYASGIYFYRLKTDEKTLTKKMVLMK